MAVRWSRRASLECLITKAEVKAERDQKNQSDGCEAMVGNQFPLSGGEGLFGAVPARRIPKAQPP